MHTSLVAAHSVPDDRHTSNVVAALALAVTDRVWRAAAEVVELPQNDLVAVSALHHILGAPSIEQLRRVLGLSHSATVRLVDRLVAANLASHQPGPDRRTTATTLTADGHAAAERVRAARSATVQTALDTLTDSDRATLDRIAGEVLVAMMRGTAATRWMCRLCDTGACGRYDDRCPIGCELTRRTT